MSKQLEVVHRDTVQARQTQRLAVLQQAAADRAQLAAFYAQQRAQPRR